jgi:voltage-gated sodium channel
LNQTTEREFVNAYGSIEEIQPFRIKWLSKLLYSRGFELFITAVILVNAIALAVLTLPGLSPQVKQAFENLDSIAFGVFLVELSLRIISYGKKPWMFFSRGWNIFDFIVIGTAPLFQSTTTIFRLLRLFRLVRIFRLLPEVRILSRSVVKSLPPLLSMSVLIGLLLFLYGMAGVYLFGEELESSWGHIGAAMMSLFILLTLENFPTYLEAGLTVSPLAIPFFFTYVFVIVFSVLNVLIGIVLNAMDEARAEEALLSKETLQLHRVVDKLEAALSDEEISTEELKTLKQELNDLKKIRRL